MGRTDRIVATGLRLAVTLGALVLPGCSGNTHPGLQKYVDILASTDMRGTRLVVATDAVCPIFDAEDFSAAEPDGGVGHIEVDEIDTWSISQPLGISATKSLEINIDKATGACTAYVKQNSTF